MHAWWGVPVDKPRIAVACLSHPVENSPAVKGITHFLADRGTHPELIVDRLSIDRSFVIPGVRIHHALRFATPRILDKLCRPLVRAATKRRRLSALERLLPTCDFCYAIEMHSLRLIHEAGFPLERTGYFSLESEAAMRGMDRAAVNALLGGCAFRVIQSPERADGLNAYLGAHHEFEYLPVALRPYDAPERAILPPHEGIRLVHSGYFAPWAGLTDILTAFRDMPRASLPPVSLLLQGHSRGAERYRADIERLASAQPDVSVDTGFYNDELHRDLLAGHHIGLALYDGKADSPNWQHLLFSSGKIASYLWAGLAVITNIRVPHTQHPPFLSVKQLTPSSLYRAIRHYLEASETYRADARRFADTYYNLDSALTPLLAKTLAGVSVEPHPEATDYDNACARQP